MLDYEWGNPNNVVMLSPDTDSGSIHGSDPTRHHHHHHHQHNHASTFVDHYASSQASAFNNFVPTPPPPPPHPHHQTATFADLFNPTHHHAQQLHSIYDPHAYASASTYAPPHHHHHHSLLPLDPIHGGAANGLMLIPKTEDMCPPVDFASRIGLNLGGRTYFASEDDFMNRLYRRSRPGSEITSTHSPRCQAEGCAADLSHSKHYHRRHKVCEFHSKASSVIANGLTQRFCQQCSRFHLLSEFDNGKRSCRKRLADHNRRRRKTQQTIQENHNSQHQQQPLEKARNSSSDNVAMSPPESAALSASSVTVAVSPPRMTLNCFRQRVPYQTAAATTSSGSSSSLFFSSG